MRLSNDENPSVISLATPHERTRSQINHNEITISRSQRREDADKTVSKLCYLRQKGHRGCSGITRKWRDVDASWKIRKSCATKAIVAKSTDNAFALNKFFSMKKI